MFIHAVVPVQKNISRRYMMISVCAALVTFLAYTSIYAYRKPITAATFDGIAYWGIPYQSLLIIAQGIGYTLSKIVGVKFISELKRFGRWKTVIMLITISWMSLLAFALTPPPYGALFLLLNGFPLGFLWGIVFSYIEGRRATDFIAATMAVSFVFAGGFTRSVGKWLVIECSVSEKWMPFTTGLIFIIPLVILLFFLEKIPAPNPEDIIERSPRLSMGGPDRRRFLNRFGPGILFVTLTYVFLTLLRDIRDNFMVNIWTELGHGSDYSLFTKSESLTSILLLILMGSLVVVRKNIIAFRAAHIMICTGLIISGVSSLLFSANMLSGCMWMLLTGLGLYMGYIPFNCIYFERMIAAFHEKGNVGFLMYFADAFGYLATIVVMCYKALFHTHLNWSRLFSQCCIVASLLGIATILFSFIYFNRKYEQSE